MKISGYIVVIVIAALSAGCRREITVDMKDFGLTPGTPENATGKLRDAFDFCKSLGKPVRLRLEKGCYEIMPETGEPLFRIDSLSGFTFDGAGSVLYFHGLSGLALVTNSSHVCFENFTIDWHRPYITQADVVDMSDSHIDIRIDSLAYPYIVKDGYVRYICDDGEYDVVEDSYCNYLTPEGKVVPGTWDDYELYKVLNGPVTVLPTGVLRFHGNVRSNAPAGSRMLVYHVRYKTPWCVSLWSADLTFRNIVVHHCVGIGVLAECCTDIMIDNVDYVPSEGRVFTGVADAFHVNYAAGKIEMKNCDIDGQGDDAINIHGKYMKVVAVDSSGRNLVCRSKNSVPLVMAGDSVWFVTKDNMLRSRKYAAESFARRKDADWNLIIDKPLDSALAHDELYLENASRNPDVHIHDNRFGKGNRARGVLVTTPGKVIIENNVFESSGTAVLIEGDLNYWYESGGVTDVRIMHNTFDHCRTSPWGAAVIAVTPSTDIRGYHKGIVVSDNRFIMAKGTDVLYSVDSTAVSLVGNRFEW